MSASFYIIKPEDLQRAVTAEHTTLKDAEKDLRAAQPGDYLVVQVVRSAHVEEVPTRIRVAMAATRTRVPRDPSTPRKPRKPRTPKVVA